MYTHSNYWGDADVDRSQTIGEDTAKLLEGIYPPLFRHPWTQRRIAGSGIEPGVSNLSITSPTLYHRAIVTTEWLDSGTLSGACNRNKYVSRRGNNLFTQNRSVGQKMASRPNEPLFCSNVKKEQ